MNLDTAFEMGLLRGAVVAARVSGLLLFAPFFSDASIPARLKIMLMLALTAAFYPLSSQPQAQDAVALVTLIGTELSIGALMGLVVQLTLEAVRLAGHVLGAQIGFSVVSLLDPQTQAENPVLATFHGMVALLIFLQCDVHHWMLQGLARSFRYLPPGTAHLRATAIHSLTAGVGGLWAVAVQMAAPILVATIATDLALGFLGKLSPNLPVLLMGISTKNLVGLAMAAALLKLWPSWLEAHFRDAVELMESTLRLCA